MQSAATGSSSVWEGAAHRKVLNYPFKILIYQESQYMLGSAGLNSYQSNSLGYNEEGQALVLFAQ